MVIILTDIAKKKDKNSKIIIKIVIVITTTIYLMILLIINILLVVICNIIYNFTGMNDKEKHRDTPGPTELISPELSTVKYILLSYNKCHVI